MKLKDAINEIEKNKLRRITQKEISEVFEITQAGVATLLEKELPDYRVKLLEQYFGINLSSADVNKELMSNFSSYQKKKYGIQLSDLSKMLSEKVGYEVNQSKIAEILEITRQTVSRRVNSGSILSGDEIQKVEKFFDIQLVSASIVKNPIKTDNCVPVKYLPNVYLSAGYGVEVYDEQDEVLMLDESLFISDRGIKTNHKNCEIVRVSGNSMSPDYIQGDRVIIDKNDKTLSDGQIYAFRYDGQCYVKEINRAGDKIKCISVNKEYDPFYIERDRDFEVFGRVLPRVRL